MISIYYVRHGQTELNKKHVVQGRNDSALTALGQMQAYITGQYFADKQIHFDHVYSSPAGRAKATAMLVCPYHQAQVVDDFVETGYGKLEGTHIDVFHGIAVDKTYSEYGAEHPKAVQKRNYEALASILKDTPDGSTILIIGHGSAGFRLASAINQPLAKKLRKFGNCSIYKYTMADSIESLQLESIELGPAALLDEADFD